MPSALQRLFFLGDIHAPYEDKRSLGLALDALEHFQPDIVVCVGDLLDCFSVSSFSKDPARALGLKGEVTHAQSILDKIQADRKIFIEGNHEDRLRRYLTDKAPELLPFVSIPKLLDLKAKGWEHVPYKDSIQIGKLWITHDVGYSGRYANFRALDAFQASVVTGHTHRLGYAVEGDARGNYHVSAQFGWLGDYGAVDYMHRVQARRAWAHGFGTGLFEPSTGYVYLRVHPIVDYTVEVDGVRFIRRAKKKPKKIGVIA